jgi:glycosyltransferase involved in cell wall biosynthesis
VKVLQIYNEQRSLFGGEPAVVRITTRVLEANGHSTRLLMKSSREIETSFVRKAGAFFGGVYNVFAYREMQLVLAGNHPDVVHVHSVFPMFSPSVLVACHRAGVPVVMTVHSHILTCPTWYHLYKGEICEDCVGGHEYRCFTKNCRGNILESAAYALRSGVARVLRLFRDNVTLFIALSQFGKNKLVHAGFPADQIVVVPNATSVSVSSSHHRVAGDYVGFAGRVSREKGIDTLLSAALSLTDVPIRLAGNGPVLAEMVARAPSNVSFVGMLEPDALIEFYRRCRFVVVPSLTFEQFPMVAVDAMALGLPVVASRIGALPELIDDGVQGLLFVPGNADDLAQKMRILWQSPDVCRRIGAAARAKVDQYYSQTAYYGNLMRVYSQAIQLMGRQATTS